MEVVSSDSKASIADATYALRDPCLAKEVVLHHTTNWLRLEENSIVVGLTECMYIVHMSNGDQNRTEAVFLKETRFSSSPNDVMKK